MTPANWNSYPPGPPGPPARLGVRFSGADELCAYASLSPDRADSRRDLMLFT